MHHIRKYSLLNVFFIISILFFSACSLTDRLTRDPNLKPAPFDKITHESSWYESQLTVSIPEYNHDWQILLARSYSKEGKLDKASDVVAQIKTNAVTPLQGNQADIVDAQIKARKGQYKEALELLDTVNTLTLSQDSVKFYYVLKGNVYAKLNNQVGAATNYLEAAKYYDGQEKTDLYKRANDYLIQSSTKDIYAAFKVNKNQIDRGFFEYALIQKSKNTNSRYKQLERFEKKYPNHPVLSLSQTQSTTLVEDNSVSQQQPIAQQSSYTIAVFLPLTGKHAELVGNPTKMGILNAYKDRGLNVNLKFYDTESASITTLYQQALTDNAKVIIGPIVKEQVDGLIAQNPQIPVIALNEGNASHNSKVFYLTLDPKNDALNAVNQISSDNFTNPIVIAPKNQKGEKISYALNSYWHKLHNTGVSVCYFSDINSLKNTLNTCFKNSSTAFDAAYVYATANEASIIREYTKQVTKNVPMFYIGARSNNGVMNSSALSGLNGMKLGDQPWLVKNSTKKEEIVQLLPRANGDSLRCFGIGYDALNLALGISNLVGNSSEMINGLSGNIYIDAQGNVTRDITWIIVGY